MKNCLTRMAASLKKAFMGPARPASSTMSRRACLTVESLEERQLMATGLPAVFPLAHAHAMVAQALAQPRIQSHIFWNHRVVEGVLRFTNVSFMHSTGVTLQIGGTSLDLVLPRELQALAHKLNGQKVVVDGYNGLVNFRSLFQVKKLQPATYEVKLEGILEYQEVGTSACPRGYYLNTGKERWHLKEPTFCGWIPLTPECNPLGLKGHKVVVSGTCSTLNSRMGNKEIEVRTLAPDTREHTFEGIAEFHMIHSSHTTGMSLRNGSVTTSLIAGTELNLHVIQLRGLSGHKVVVTGSWQQVSHNSCWYFEIQTVTTAP